MMMFVRRLETELTWPQIEATLYHITDALAIDFNVKYVCETKVNASK